MIVAGMVGLLISIGYPNYQISQDKARNAAMVTNVKTLQTAMIEYASEHDGAYPNSPDVLDLEANPANWEAGTIGLSSHLPGGFYPRSPWASEPQAQLISPYDAGAPEPLNSATQLGEDGIVKRAGTPIGDGSPPENGSNYSRQTYGALLYSRDPDKQIILLYGVGKKFEEAVVAFGISNEGGTAGGGN